MSQTRRAAIASAFLFFVSLRPVAAQSTTEEILNELRRIRQLLERLTPSAPPRDERAKLPPLSGPVLGRKDAPVTIVEFTDAECPFCRQFHATTFQDIKKNYIDTGRVRFTMRDFPLGIHPNAKQAAIATRCAGEQGKFWELRTALELNAAGLSPSIMLGHAAGLGLEMKAFQTCLASGKFEAELQKDLDVAAAIGVTGTPTFVIGKTGSTEDGWKIVGALPYAAFAEKIEQLLAPDITRSAALRSDPFARPAAPGSSRRRAP